MSRPGWSPESRIRFLARSTILTGCAHFENEYLSALADRESLQDQLGRLRNGHKIAGYFRMSDSYRAACGNLFLEDWNNTTVASKYISEAHRNKLGTSFYLQCANQQLCDALCSAHHAGWPHRLVRGNHDKIVDSVLSRRTGNIPRAEDVRFDSSEDVFFH